MALYQSAPGVETKGSTILGLIAGLGAFSSIGMQILEENGIGDPQPDLWYSHQAYMDALKAIASRTGPKTLLMMGKQVPKVATLPPNIDSAEKAMGMLNDAYYMNIRGGKVGGFKFTMTGEKSGVMVCDNPYPDEYVQGILTGFVQKFNPIGRAKVDETKPTKNGGSESTTYMITW